jgi:3-hydroxybutyryl-CoA dehydratase
MAIEKGQTFKDSEIVDKYRTLYYAGASGDFNLIHIDPEFGKMVGLGGAILQGLCTMAFAARSVTDLIGDPGKLKKLKCRFSAPVMLEDTLTIQGTVSDIKDGLGYIDLKVTKQTGVEVLQKVEAVVEV